MNNILHKLTPIEEIESGWFRLKWKPIKNGTWNIYFNWYGGNGFKFEIYKCNVHNGWGRSWDGYAIYICCYFRVDAWIHYNHICMREGAFDTTDSDGKPFYPLDFTNSKLKS